MIKIDIDPDSDLNSAIKKLLESPEKDNSYIIFNYIKIYGSKIHSIEDGRKIYFNYYNTNSVSSKLNNL